MKTNNKALKTVNSPHSQLTEAHKQKLIIQIHKRPKPHQLGWNRWKSMDLNNTSEVKKSLRRRLKINRDNLRKIMTRRSRICKISLIEKFKKRSKCRIRC